MTRLFLVRDDERELWLAALVDEDMWTYVANTGKFHRNEGARHDYYFLNDLQYDPIGIVKAKRLINAGVGAVDETEFSDLVQEWRDDPQGMDAEVIFATTAADLA
jgi:hypothetical protein